MNSFEQILDKAYEAKTAKGLISAPVHALVGVSAADADLLARAFGIQTIGDLCRTCSSSPLEQIADIAAR